MSVCPSPVPPTKQTSTSVPQYPPDVEGLGQKCPWQGIKQDHYCCLKNKLHWQQQNLSFVPFGLVHFTPYWICTLRCYMLCTLQKSQKLAGLCMELEDQVKDMEAIIADSENQEAQWNDMKWAVCLVTLNSHGDSLALYLLLLATVQSIFQQGNKKNHRFCNRINWFHKS